MFLLPSIGVGLALAFALGGRPSRLERVRFAQAWAALAALAIQVVLFSSVGAYLPHGAISGAHLVSYGLLAWFAAANRRLRALVLTVLGLGLNAAAIAVNGGEMPVSLSAARAAGRTVFTNVSPEAHRLWYLGDVFALPKGLPLANVFSVGDILIGIGVISFIVLVSLDSEGDRPLQAGRLLRPLRSRPFRMLAGGKFVSATGDWLTLAALVGWIYHSTRSTGQVAALLLVRLAPPILGGGVAAMIVDRLPKKGLLVWIELARGVAVAGALAGLLTNDRLAVFAAFACSGVLAAVSSATVPALVPSLLERDELVSANAVLGIAKDAAMALGALGAGVALSSVGPSVALVADLVTFAVACALFSRLPRIAAPQRAVVRERAVAYLFRSRSLSLLVLSFAAATIATGLTNASLPRFLGTQIGFGAGGYGFGLGALAAGLVLGETLVGFARMGRYAGRWIGIALIVMSGLFVLLGLTHHAATALLVVGGIGFVDGTTDVIFVTVLQRETSPERYGAVFGLASASITTTMLAAVALAPVANRFLAVRGVIMTASIFLLGAGAIALLRDRVAMTEKPAAPSWATAATNSRPG